jgi:peptide/nickel transport system substrate-binding protein
MTSKRIPYIVIVSLMATLLWVGVTSKVVYAQRHGAQADLIQCLTIKSPDAQLIAMQTGQIDVLPDMIRPDDIETLSDDGYLVTSKPGFHMGFVGFNLRRNVTHDVAFRRAIVHAYDQEDICASIYRYTVTPIRSLVPPAQGIWTADDIPTYPYNPGDSGDAPGTESTFGILKGAGYVYHGAGYGDLNGYWVAPYDIDGNGIGGEDPGDRLRDMIFYTPTYEVAPTSAEHGARLSAELARCGLGCVQHEPADFTTYTGLVFDNHDFDIFMIFWSLGRFPLQLYGLCHSSEYVLGSDHAVGINDPVLDDYLETLKYDLDRPTQIEAAKDAQRRLYDASQPWGLPYMTLYSRVYFTATAKGLNGIVNSPGYGADNFWTWMNMRWETGGGIRPGGSENLVIYCNGEETRVRSPVASTTAYEWNTIGNMYDTLIAVNPYTNEDLLWQAEAWNQEVVTESLVLDSDNLYHNKTPAGAKYLDGDTFEIIDGIKVRFDLADGLYWQDGNPVTASDCEFSLEFLRNNQIPQYITTWQDIIDVQVIDADEFVVYANVTSPFLVYYWAGAALLLAPQVWSWMSWTGPGAIPVEHLDGILAYDPTANTTDTGPWSYPTNAMGPKTCLFGTGPLVYDEYDPVGFVAYLHNWDVDGDNVGYFKTSADIYNMKVERLHDIGDIDRDGDIDYEDQSDYGTAFGTVYTPPPLMDEDLNQDGTIDWEDGALIGAFYGTRREEMAPL